VGLEGEFNINHLVLAFIAADNFSADILNSQLSSHSITTDLPPAKSTISG
jgi:hypothetical protein